MNTGSPALSAARSEPAGTFISNTMMVMMMAITPSVNASSRCLLTVVLYLRDVQPNIGIQTRFSESHPPTPHTIFGTAIARVYLTAAGGHNSRIAPNQIGVGYLGSNRAEWTAQFDAGAFLNDRRHLHAHHAPAIFEIHVEV